MTKEKYIFFPGFGAKESKWASESDNLLNDGIEIQRELHYIWLIHGQFTEIVPDID